MRYFADVVELNILEQQEKWEIARELLFDQWNNDKSNINWLLRLLSECWYVLSEWDCCIKNENLSFQQFKESLIQCTEYGLLHFKDDSRFLCIAGYMISLFPFLFYQGDSNSQYLKWEQKGRDMLDRAYSLNPDDPVAKVLCLGTRSQDKEYFEVKANLSDLLDDLFQGNTVIEQYFKDILSINK